MSSPDDQAAASDRDRTDQAVLVKPHEHRAAAPEPTAIVRRRGAFSPDGKRIATTSEQPLGTVKVADARLAALLPPLSPSTASRKQRTSSGDRMRWRVQ